VPRHVVIKAYIVTSLILNDGVVNVSNIAVVLLLLLYLNQVSDNFLCLLKLLD